MKTHVESAVEKTTRQNSADTGHRSNDSRHLMSSWLRVIPFVSKPVVAKQHPGKYRAKV